MGSLPPDEQREIDELRQNHSELNEEILRIEDAMIAYADSHAIKPKAALKNQIAKKLNFAVTLDLDNERIDTILIQMPGIYKLAAAAAIALIIALTGTTIHFSSKYNAANKQALTLQAEKDQLSEQVKTVGLETEKIKSQLVATSDPGNQTISLKGLPIAPQAKAIVYWNKESGAVYLNSSFLPAVAANEQFQLWAIVDGKPVDAGVIDKSSTFAQMKTIKNASAFAITLEALGGKPSPSLDKMYVKGNA